MLPLTKQLASVYGRRLLPPATTAASPSRQRPRPPPPPASDHGRQLSTTIKKYSCRHIYVYGKLPSVQRRSIGDSMSTKTKDSLENLIFRIPGTEHCGRIIDRHPYGFYSVQRLYRPFSKSLVHITEIAGYIENGKPWILGLSPEETLEDVLPDRPRDLNVLRLASLRPNIFGSVT
jgi:hypothetical protein